MKKLLFFIFSTSSFYLFALITPFPNGNTSLSSNSALVTNSQGTDLTGSAATSTEVGYANGITSALQPQLNASISGPTSSTDGAVMTMRGSSAASANSESKFIINPSTGAVTETFIGSPSTLRSLNLGTATTWSKVYSLTGTIAATPVSMVFKNVTPSYSIEGNSLVYHEFISPTISGSTSDQALEKYSLWSSNGSGTMWGIYNSAFSGIGGTLQGVANGSTTGNAMGAAFLATGHNSIGLRGYAYGSTGTAGTRTSVGVIGTGGRGIGSPTARAAGGYFVLLTDGSQSADENIVDPGVTAGLVSDTRDGTSPSFVALNNGSSIFQVQTALTVIGAYGDSTSLHTINGATVAPGAQTLTITNGPAVPTVVAAVKPQAYWKVRINGANYVIPYWLLAP